MPGQVDRTDASYRKRRVQRLKKIIVITVSILILIPNLVSVLLIFRIAALNKELAALGSRVELAEEKAKSAGQDPGSGYRNPANAGMADGSAMSAFTGDADTKPEEEPSDSIPVWQEPEEAGSDVSEHAHLVYLTFDDGPSIYTEEILDILDSYNVKATFFVVGNDTEENRERIREIVNRGHTLGMHSYTHKYDEIYRTRENFIEDFHKIQDFLYEVTGQAVRYYRFPGGSSNSVSSVDMHELAEYLQEQGVTFYDWNIASGDATNKVLSIDEMVANSTQTIPKWHTCIVLMHDSADKHSTVEALPTIIENILAMDDTVILPITDDTVPVQHIKLETNNQNQ